MPRVGTAPHFGGERVGQRVRQELAESSDETVGAFSSVEVEHG